MTISIPPVTFPAPGTGRDTTSRLPASGLVLVMARPAAPAPGHRSQAAPPGWPGDRSGLWLRNAAAGLCVLAAAAAVVSFTAQYRMAETARHLPAVAALEAAIPDAAALVFACLGIALAVHGRRALRARALNLASVGAPAGPDAGYRARVRAAGSARAAAAGPAGLRCGVGVAVGPGRWLAVGGDVRRRGDCRQPPGRGDRRRSGPLPGPAGRGAGGSAAR